MEGIVSNRRKSSVFFSPDLKTYEPAVNEWTIQERENNDDPEICSTLIHSSASRLSIFSRISQVSTLSTKFQFSVLFCTLLMVFVIGFVVGTITVNNFLCNDNSFFKVRSAKTWGVC